MRVPCESRAERSRGQADPADRRIRLRLIADNDNEDVVACWLSSLVGGMEMDMGGRNYHTIRVLKGRAQTATSLRIWKNDIQ
jgi:hypothetical protein